MMEQTACCIWRSRTCNVGLSNLALADLCAKVDCPKGTGGKVAKYIGIHVVLPSFGVGKRAVRASTCSPAEVHASRALQAWTNGVLPPVSACAAVACSRAARKKVRWSAVEAPDDGRFEPGPIRRAVCRHDLSCEHSADVQPTVPKHLLPSSKSRTSISIRHSVTRH